MKSRYFQNKILFDWVSITSKIDSVESIIDLIGFYDIQFIDTYGLYGYKHRLMFDGVSIMYGGIHDSVMLEMSGQGCRCFESYGNGDFYALFRHVLENSDDVNITRLDVAYDDFNYLLDLDAIYQDVINRNFVSKCDSGNVGFQYQCKNGGSWTITAGNRGSNIFMRIYDKSRERNAMDEFPHWVRCELQIRHSHACQFIRFLLGGQAYSPNGDVIIKHLRLDSLYFSVLNHFFRIIDIDANDDSNKWRKPMRDHWKKFAHSVTTQRISLYVKPGVEYNLLRLDHSVEQQYAGMIYTYIQCHSIDELVNVVSKKRGNLSVKHRQIINERQAQMDEYFKKLTMDCRKI